MFAVVVQCLNRFENWFLLDELAVVEFALADQLCLDALCLLMNLAVLCLVQALGDFVHLLDLIQS